jgi:hypothetical protein
MHDLMTPHVMAVTLGLVDDGELLVYPSDLWLPGSQVDDPYLIYGEYHWLYFVILISYC